MGILKRERTAAKSRGTTTLVAIQQAIGQPDSAALEALLEGSTEAEIVAEGRGLPSRYILENVSQIYAHAFEAWQHASDVQKNRLRGFSQELLAAGVQHALTLQQLSRAVDGRRRGGATSTRSGNGNGNGHGNGSKHARGPSRETWATIGHALALRDQAKQIFICVAGHDKKLAAEISIAFGSAQTMGELANALERLSRLGTKMLSGRKGALATRASFHRLDQKYVDLLEGMASSLRAHIPLEEDDFTSEAQEQIDHEYGVNAIVLSQIVRAFETAHDLDPTIPKLVPSAIRRLLKPWRTRPESTTFTQEEIAAKRMEAHE